MCLTNFTEKAFYDKNSFANSKTKAAKYSSK
jgi:hypothetical protein